MSCFLHIRAITSSCFNSHDMSRTALSCASKEEGTVVLFLPGMVLQVSPVQSVGIHPCKEWADDNYTIADLDCPVHAAAARGHVKVVQYYLLTYPDCVMVIR